MHIKNTYQSILKFIFYGLVVVLLFIPMLQQATDYYKETPLNGSYTSTEDPTLTLPTWLNGAYQEQKQSYLNERFGFRTEFVRFYNQIYFDLFNQARANDVIIGKEQYLYGGTYIDAYTGDDFIGAEKIQEQIKKLALIRDTLHKKGIDLIYVLAPGKGSFYPEYLPEQFKKSDSARTNYEEIKKGFEEANILTLDFHSWFLQMKDSLPYPLFPKTGIHWSKYGEFFAADSLLHYIGNLRNTSMPWLDTFGFETTKEVRDTDDDIEKGMNINTEIPDLEMGYFFTQIKQDTTNNYPKVSVIGDSYYWGLVALGMSEKGFNKGDFWYYFNERHFSNGTPMQQKGDMTDAQIQEAIEDNDVILMLTTDANLSHFGHGFIDKMYEIYFPK